ncbi:MAG: SDR family oxidoreductase [Actinobacteria bacterium]|nr:SDR family oxidoreductase [Actinomycetota bacterium]
MPDIFGLDGDVALVIGSAAGGLGGHAALCLAGAGATLALADLPDRGEDLSAIARQCPNATTHEVDVTDEGSVGRLIDEVMGRHGRIDVLVCTAGVMLRKELEDTELREWQRVLDVNLTGTWLANRAVAPIMRQQGSGRIVNFSTVYAERVGPIPESAYYASKAGIANVTRAVASELGPHGVTVNCLAPAVFYPTRMTAPLADDPARLEWFTGRTMLGRLGDPERDLAGPLLLLASNAGRYITGQVLYVDGGWSAW